MKVLIITYYWPPAGGSGVQRWLKFVKYLQDFGVEPVVYIPKNANYPINDFSLESDVPKNIEILRYPIKNPQDFLPTKQHKKGVANVSKGGFLSWVRGNFFIPDAKKYWIKPSVKFLKKYLSENKVDAVITTGPPHSLHLIGFQLKKELNIKWLADFRDPWTSLYYNEDFNLSSFAKEKNKKLETEVLKNADIVLTVSNSLKKEFSKTAKKVAVITNGFDSEVYLKDTQKLSSKFSISHVGLLPKQSNPTILWEALKEISEENPQFLKDLEINLTGNVNDVTLQGLKDIGLDNNLVLNGYVSHKAAIELQQQAQVLLLLIPKTVNSQGIITGKIFEYLQAKRPILAIGPEDGDLAAILNNTNAGFIVGFEEKLKLKTVILELYNKYKNGNLAVDSSNIEQYHRKNLTEKLSVTIKELIKNSGNNI